MKKIDCFYLAALIFGVLTITSNNEFVHILQFVLLIAMGVCMQMEYNKRHYERG